MLGVLKEELFQLETDRLNGKISEEEYIKTKAGLGHAAAPADDQKITT